MNPSRIFPGLAASLALAYDPAQPPRAARVPTLSPGRLRKRFAISGRQWRRQEHRVRMSNETLRAEGNPQRLPSLVRSLSELFSQLTGTWTPRIVLQKGRLGRRSHRNWCGRWTPAGWATWSRRGISHLDRLALGERAFT